MSNELHIAAYVDQFPAFPSAAFALVLSHDPAKLTKPDRRDRNRSIVVTQELSPARIDELRRATVEVGRVVLLFSAWTPFKQAQRALTPL